MAKYSTKQAEIDWDEFVLNMNRNAPVNLNETGAEKRKRIAALEANHEKWFKYYFPNYYTSEPANFHKRSTKRVMSNAEWVEARAWSRELSKSGRTMMEALKLSLTGKKFNWILTSNSKDNAERLLKPYKVILESNNRIINDYGVQVKHGSWTDSEFITRKGVAFRAVGKGQSPRGSRNDAKRPDGLIIDDFDTDESCRNPERVEQDWDWLERAFYATRSISNPLLVIFCGNIIAEHCCMKKAIEMADKAEIINIRDKDGKSTWPQKNTEANIDRVLSKISYNAAQGEYFNNPITQGKVFNKLHYKKVQPFSRYKFLVAYTDPSYKSGKKNDFKATVLAGRYKNEYHILKVFCEQTTVANMLNWQYQILQEVNGRCPVFFLIEWPWIDETLKMEIEKANERHKLTLPLKADPRTKPDKFYRIESLLEPLNRNEKLWFNEKLLPSEHMKNMQAQFLALSPTSRAHDDGPDAVEGAIFSINSKTSADPGKIETNHNTFRNPNRY